MQWWRDGLALASATNTTLTLSNISSADLGSYWMVVTNAADSATSSVAVLTVVTPPVKTNPPATGFAPLVAGINQVTAAPGAPGPVLALSPEWETIAAGDEDSPPPSAFAVARQFGAGRIVA
ncbi:MAG: hypothetical protein COW16_04090, partial [Sphingomonadales bacterium CG12_big_fil_rev_8_21_14_0_65_65_10]